MGVYYGFAKNFGYTPSQVDELDIITLQSFAMIGNSIQVEEQRAMKRGRRS